MDDENRNEDLKDLEKLKTQEPNKRIFDTRHAWRIILILLFAGIVSGIRNHLKEEIIPSGSLINVIDNLNVWLYHIISAIIAASLVPLFLHFIHSDLVLIDKTDENNIRNNMKAFILFGFCLIAGSFSDRFIEGIYSASIQKEINESKKERIAHKEKNDLLVSNLLYVREQEQLKKDSTKYENDKIIKINNLVEEYNITQDEANVIIEITEMTPLYKNDLIKNYSDSDINIEDLLKRLIKEEIFVEIEIKEKLAIVTKDIYEGN